MNGLDDVAFLILPVDCVSRSDKGLRSLLLDALDSLLSEDHLLHLAHRRDTPPRISRRNLVEGEGYPRQTDVVARAFLLYAEGVESARVYGRFHSSAPFDR